MNACIVVTGASGYLGSHTCVELLARGHRVVAVDNLENSHPEALVRAGRLGGGCIELHTADIRDRATIESILAEHAPAAVIHFAGRKSVAESLQDPLAYFDTNVAGSLSLLQAMDATDVRQLIFSSSCTVYGSGVDGVMPVDESSPLRPVSPYGHSKMMAERIMEELAGSDSAWQITALRYFNPAGAHPSGLIGEDPRNRPNNLMPLVMRAVTDPSESLIVHGNDYPTPDGTCVRDYVHVVDIARAHLRALDALAPGFRSFNLGTGRGTSVLELLATVGAVTGLPTRFEFGERRPGDAVAVWADPSNAADALGWRAEFDLTDMCRDHWRWHAQNGVGHAD